MLSSSVLETSDLINKGFLQPDSLIHKILSEQNDSDIKDRNVETHQLLTRTYLDCYFAIQGKLT